MKKLIIVMIIFLIALFLSTCSANLLSHTVAASLAPKITGFNTAASAMTANRIIPVQLETYDDGEVRKWYIAQAAEVPGAGTAWLEQLPQSFTLTGGYGEYTLYAWVMDDEGRVSAPAALELSYVAPGTADPAWNLAFDGGAFATILDVAVDNAGNVYIAAAASDIAGAGSSFDAWLKKFDKNGVEDVTYWNKMIDGGTEFIPRALAIDSQGNVYAGGSGADISGAGSGRDWFIKKYNSLGVEDTVNWNKVFDGNAQAAVLDMAIDANGNLYAVGYGEDIDDSVAFDTGYDWWIKKFNQNGIEDTVNWDKKIDGTRVETIRLDKATAVCINPQGYVYVAGYVRDKIEPAGTSSQGDILVKKFNSAGVEDTVEWNLVEDGNAIGPIRNDELYGLAVNSTGRVYTVGFGNNLVNNTSGVDWWIIGYTDAGWGSDRKPFMEAVYDFDPGNNSAAEESRANSVVIDSAGNAYVTGTGLNLVSTTSSYDWHIKKFTALGSEDPAWALSVDGNGSVDKAYACCLDARGNLYAAGCGTNLVNGSSSLDLWLKKFVNDIF